MDKLQEKISYGISLIRYNYKYNKYEILMIKKRNSYSFINFAMGIYIINEYELYGMFNNMTFYEKRIILTMNFEYIWSYLWNTDKIEYNYNYLAKKKIFDTNFSSLESKNLLKKIIT